jgi:hypothetical protein
MFGPQRPRKTYAYYKQTIPAGSDIDRGSNSTLGVVSTFGGIWPGLGWHHGRKDLHLEGGRQHRHLRQCRSFSTAEPVPRLEATLRVAQQCQSSTSIMGQSAAGGGATVDMAKSGPAVMAAAGDRKRQSNRLQAHVPSWSSRGALSHGVKTTRPCSVPRTTRTRGRPANRPSRCINSSARQATPLVGEAGVVSPPP